MAAYSGSTTASSQFWRASNWAMVIGGFATAPAAPAGAAPALPLRSAPLSRLSSRTQPRLPCIGIGHSQVQKAVKGRGRRESFVKCRTPRIASTVIGHRDITPVRPAIFSASILALSFTHCPENPSLTGCAALWSVTSSKTASVSPREVWALFAASPSYRFQVKGFLVIIGEPVVPLGLHADEGAHGVPENQPCQDATKRHDQAIPMRNGPDICRVHDVVPVGSRGPHIRLLPN